MAITSYNKRRKRKVILFMNASLQIDISASLIQHKHTCITAHGVDNSDMFPHCQDFLNPTDNCWGQGPRVWILRRSLKNRLKLFPVVHFATLYLTTYLATAWFMNAEFKERQWSWPTLNMWLVHLPGGTVTTTVVQAETATQTSRERNYSVTIIKTRWVNLPTFAEIMPVHVCDAVSVPKSLDRFC
jgi:hypothetical protein